MSSSNCCFLTCIQISQEAGKVVWYSSLFKNIPQFVVIHTISFGIVNKAEVDVFLKQNMMFFWSKSKQNRYICLISKLMFLYHNAAKMIQSLTLHIPGISVSNLGMKRRCIFFLFLNTINRSKYHGRKFILGLISWKILRVPGVSQHFQASRDSRKPSALP